MRPRPRDTRPSSLDGLGAPLRRASILGLVALSACGGGGWGDLLPSSTDTPAPKAVAALEILTTPLPAGHVGADFGPRSLESRGGTGAPTWMHVAGALPPGIGLSPTGTLQGIPMQPGVFRFTVRATQGAHAAVRSFTLGVDRLALAADDLRFGDAWSGEGVRVMAAGLEGSAAFQTVVNASGGQWLATDAQGSAVWLPGPWAGPGVIDRLRVIEVASARTADLHLPVMPHPAPSHVARFAGTDVWYVDFEARHGTHPFASDWHQTLRKIGFRAAASYDPEGTEADRLADYFLRREVLRHLNTHFGRRPDGEAGDDGLPISFPLREPSAPYVRPEPNARLAGGPNRFSVIALCEGGTSGSMGTAIQDSVLNEAHENDTPSAGAGPLGVFLDELVRAFNFAYRNDALPTAPVDAGDVAALRALVYDLPSPGGRHALLATVGRDFARSAATVCAHEIGHSLGLHHTDPPSPGSLMNSAVTIAPFAELAFHPGDILILRGALPGLKRSAASASGAGASGPVAAPLGVGGICVCGSAHR